MESRAFPLRLPRIHEKETALRNSFLFPRNENRVNGLEVGLSAFFFHSFLPLFALASLATPQKPKEKGTKTICGGAALWTRPICIQLWRNRRNEPRTRNVFITSAAEIFRMIRPFHEIFYIYLYTYRVATARGRLLVLMGRNNELFRALSPRSSSTWIHVFYSMFTRWKEIAIGGSTVFNCPPVSGGTIRFVRFHSVLFFIFLFFFFF